MNQPAFVRSFFRQALLAAGLLALTVSPARAETKFVPVRPEIVSARLAGFGGAYSALEAGFDTLSTNPAALAYVDKTWSVARLAVNVSGPLFDLPSVTQSDDISTGILDLVGDNNGVYIGADLTGPVSFGMVDRNFGFGVFNRTTADASLPSLTSASVTAGEELLLVGGYGLTVFQKGPHAVSVGLQLKGFFQTFLQEKGTSVTVLNDFTSFDLTGIPAVLSTGFGMDAGLMYRFGRRLSVGVTCRDLYTPVFTTRYATADDFLSGTPEPGTETDRLDMDLSAGLVWSVPLPQNWLTITRWDLMADYRDALSMLDTVSRNPVLNIAAGTEIVFIDVVSLRAGISDTYLCTGLGLDLSVFRIDFAMYGKELGLDPGKRPLLNLALSLSFEY